MSDGKVVISTELDNSGIEKGVKSVKGSFGGLTSVVNKLGAAIGIAFSVRAIVQFGKESVNAANELSSALTGLQSIVEGQGRSFSAAQKFIEEYTKDGLIPATNAITAYKNLAMRGYDDSQIQQVMVALKDASAFGRQASYSMGEAVQSATEGLKNENSILVDNAGVTKNVAKMWDEYAASIGTTANNLTRQQKIQAEVNGILEESKYQAGDAAKVAGTLTGQLTQLSFNFNNLKVAVGNAINPIIQSFIPVINSAVQSLTRFANSVASVIGALFGKATVQTSALADSNNSVASSASTGASAEKELADATNKAGKEAQKSLARFDELNRLQSDIGTGSSNTSADTGAGGGVSTSIVADAQVEDTISPKLQAIADSIRAFVDDVKRFVEQITTALQPSSKAWGEAFSSLGPSVENARDRISTAFTNLWDNSLAPFGSYIMLDWAPGIANTFSETFAPIFADVMPVAMDTFTTDFENGCKLVSELCGMLQGAFEGVKTVFTDMCESISSNWEKYGGDILNGFTDFKNGMWEIWWYIYDNIISPVVSSCGEQLSYLWDEHLAPLWDDITEFIFSTSENILALWNGAIKPFLDFLATIFSPGIVNAIEGIISAITLLNSIFSDIFSSILTILDGLLTFVVGVFTFDWSRAWEGIKKVFEGVWNAITGIVRGAINTVIFAINRLIASIYSGIASIVNGLGKIVSNVGNMLGKRWGFSIPAAAPKIPYLAKGAVLPANKPFLAMVGDQRNGTNVEAPLSTIQEAVAIVMEDMVQSNIAGHEATVAVLQAILEAVNAIDTSDERYANAVDAYHRKVAVAKGV